MPADLEFIPDKQLSWSQQVGIAIRCLMDDRKAHLLMWLIDVSLNLLCLRTTSILTICFRS